MKTERIFSEIDRPLDFNDILVNGSVLNEVSMDNISFFCGNHYIKSYQHLNLFISYVIVKKMKLSFFISIAWFKNFWSKKKTKTDTSNQIDTNFSFYLGYFKPLIH